MNHIDANDLEQVSALADGELDATDAGLAVDLIGRSAAAMAAWQSYHVVGDVLRCSDMAVATDARAFAARVRSRLDASPAPAAAAVAAVGAAAPRGLPALPASNDPTLRWKWLAGAACLVAMASVGWQLGALEQGPGPEKLVALPATPAGATGAASAAAAAAEPARMLRDARLDELMAAHKQLGGAGALQAPSGFLRNATFESPVRR